MFSKRAQWITFLVVNSLVILGCALFPLYRSFVSALLPQDVCSAVRFLGIYCPACGGTRSLAALLQLDLVSAVKYNLLVPLGALLFVAYEVASVVCLVRGEPRQTLLKTPIVLSATGVLVVYSIVRNLLLIWDIDLLGNIIVP